MGYLDLLLLRHTTAILLNQHCLEKGWTPLHYCAAQGTQYNTCILPDYCKLAYCRSSRELVATMACDYDWCASESDYTHSETSLCVASGVCVRMNRCRLCISSASSVESRGSREQLCATPSQSCYDGKPIFKQQQQ